MTGWTTPLRTGLPVSFDGEQFTIAEVEGSRVMLRRSGAAGTSAWRQVDLVALLSHPGTRLLVQAPVPQPAVATLLGGLDGREDDELTARWRHVQEVRTGYQHGCAELALDGEPRPQYAPGVPMMARYKAKATELVVGVSTVGRWVMQAQDGPAGLVTERPARAVLDRADPRWLDAARQVIELSPLEMLEHGITRAGPLMIPARPEMALEFLEVEYVTIQHYGVEIDTLRYNGGGLNGFRNRSSTVGGTHAGKWPVAVDSGDFSRVWFQDPRDFSWHQLAWEHAAALGRPFSREAAAYARKLAAGTHRFPDTRRALAELLDRWGAGLTANCTERRMAIRLAQERLRLSGDAAIGQKPAAELPAIQQVTARQRPGPAGTAVEAAGGDDDEDGECDAVFPGEEDSSPVDEDEFYAGAWETR